MDKIHTIVSGNKWFKLSGYLQQAEQNRAKAIATFGGAYSNHIVATAYAARMKGLTSMGIIRGEKPSVLSHTLENALSYNMKLIFVSRTDYKDKQRMQAMHDPDGNYYWIPEGGYGIQGAAGIRDMLKAVPYWDYTHLVTAVGTGTTMAGLIQGALPYQKVIGMAVLNNQNTITVEMEALLDKQDCRKNYQIITDYTFGGYAKKTPELINFMNKTYQTVKLPLDFVYTAKAFYGLKNYLQNAELSEDSRVLFLHTGGLQGNDSLSPDTLCY
ncbi:1-aminocyclopropane-1-carboxylate deaminase/D-cysteine desulfhydrase [Arachidicoccus terrestris]|uniref:1-aminocyclopropane-1-carboxylate deaminase/D-cysteine desulfhydrase n=1 Tax=Arachidicoccus terrestris TaxID=2875539 RepID=UPI001CC51DE4|nr:pyridoxal-phosphate dependent enzyme [Arachidicoccus terrestris]UAY54550.1 pyridoxal-phosphate dependent enzyme [Arachidicoccus terrestris]